MAIDSLVRALERIDEAAREFLRLSDMPGAPGLLHAALSTWCEELDHPCSRDPLIDRDRVAVRDACASVRQALSALAVEVGPVPHAVVRRVRELSHMIDVMLPAFGASRRPRLIATLADPSHDHLPVVATKCAAPAPRHQGFEPRPMHSDGHCGCRPIDTSRSGRRLNRICLSRGIRNRIQA